MTYETKTDPLAEVFAAAALTDAPAADPAADVATLRAEVSRLAAQVNARAAVRPALAGAKGAAAPQAAAFTAYLRHDQALPDEAKSLNTTDGPSGGFLVPKTIDQVIARVLASISPIRQIAQVVDVGSGGYRKLVTTSGVVSGWASETGTRGDQGTPTLTEVIPPSGELYANPSATQAMLDDSEFDVETWLGEEIAREFARAEGIAFVSGDGTSKPKGFLSAATSAAADTTRPFGTLQTINSGAAGAFAATNPQDKLIDLVHSLAASYRQGASWVMNSKTLSAVRKMKDSTGAFLWQPALAADRPATLLGYPVYEAEAMPDIAVDSLAIAFGNFTEGYLITQRRETAVLRDPYSNKPFVQFYAVRRVGGTVLNSNAIKLMKFNV
jgi:HK97 family phage major capsid protein